MTTKQQAYFDRNVAAGLCGACRKPRGEGREQKKRCATCEGKHSARCRARDALRKTTGICAKCGLPKEQERLEFRLCIICADKDNARVKRYPRRKEAQP